jgi:hypothetical protein
MSNTSSTSDEQKNSTSASLQYAPGQYKKIDKGYY